jgi:hypothetical protein
MIDKFIYNFCGKLDSMTSWIDNLFKDKKKNKK